MKLRSLLAGILVGTLIGCGFGFYLFLNKVCDWKGNPQLEVKTSRVSGDELRLLVETSVYHHPLYLSHETVDHVASYYVVVNLTQPKIPLPGRTRIIALEDSPPRSDMADSGVVFTQEDHDALAASPSFFFDDENNFGRMVPDHGRYRRELLHLTPSGATWQTLRIQDLPPHIDQWTGAYSPSGRWSLRYEHNAAQLSDMRTGEQKTDPWLKAVVADLNDRRSEGRAYLSEDLNQFLDISDDWNLGYAYNRPDPLPHSFRKPPQAVNSVIFVKGEPLLFAYYEGGFKLVSLDYKVRFETPKSIAGFFNRNANDFHYSPTEHDEGIGRVTLLANLDLFKGVTVTEWYYRTGRIEQQDVNMKDVFPISSGQYRPVKSEASAN